jgi:hypothetical protein
VLGVRLGSGILTFHWWFECVLGQVHLCQKTHVEARGQLWVLAFHCSEAGSLVHCCIQQAIWPASSQEFWSLCLPCHCGSVGVTGVCCPGWQCWVYGCMLSRVAVLGLWVYVAHCGSVEVTGICCPGWQCWGYGCMLLRVAVLGLQCVLLCFMWELVIWIQVLTFVWQVLHPLSHFSGPLIMFYGYTSIQQKCVFSENTKW